ncbi:hypothetical protein MZH79_13130, partial [Escherichia coli]|nr:hypothetical protein [Escherichia coli]
ISVILFNSRFRSYGAQGVLKKHPFCGAFLVFWGFKFLSIKCFDKASHKICWLLQYNFDSKNQHSCGENRKCNMQTDEPQAYIFRPYITVKGKRITRPNGGMFKIPINREKKKQ